MSNILSQFALIILFLPLASFVLQIFFGRRLGPRAVWISVAALFTTLVLAAAMLATVALGTPMDHHPEVEWFSIGDEERERPEASIYAS